MGITKKKRRNNYGGTAKDVVGVGNERDREQLRADGDIRESKSVGGGWWSYVITALAVVAVWVMRIPSPTQTREGPKGRRHDDKGHGHRYGEEDGDRNTRRLLEDFVCKHPRGRCHPSLEALPKRRTHVVSSTVPPGETLLVLPEELLMTDLDALRLWDDSYVARKRGRGDGRGDDDDDDDDDKFPHHAGTKRPLDAGAYLAAHVAWQRRFVLDGEEGNSPNFPSTPFVRAAIHKTERMRNYLRVLPEASPGHPVSWNSTRRRAWLGKTTVAADTCRAFSDMVRSEHAALFPSSGDTHGHGHERKRESNGHHRFVPFASYVSSWEEYAVARIHVLSRSFGRPCPTIDDDEIERLEKRWGVTSLRAGCRAMSPVLDMWDHRSHGDHNADWEWSESTSSYVVRSRKIIPRGHEVFVSYGTYTDSHLFAKFGFLDILPRPNSGNDSDGGQVNLPPYHAEASLAVFHSPLSDPGLGSQFTYRRLGDNDDGTIDDLRAMMPYLAFDDGFDTCVLPGDTLTWKTKVQRLRRLYRIRSHRSHWVFRVPPGPSTLRIEPLLRTCRVIVGGSDDTDTDTDTDTSIDDDNQKDDVVEYRAYACLERLTRIALSMQPTPVSDLRRALSSYQSSDTSSLSSTSSSKRDDDVDAYTYTLHLRLGEMQALERLRRHASARQEEFRVKILQNQRDGRHNDNDNDNNNDARLRSLLFLRDRPCPYRPVTDNDLLLLQSV